MKKRSWNSIIEVVVAMTIITFWLVWSYWILNSGQKLATSTENRIKWVNIAREWIELVQNIRDTNWIKFSSDYINCWNVKDYLWASCVWTNTNAWIPTGSYILKFDSWVWKLVSKTTWTYDTPAYKTDFPIYIWADWFSFQTPAWTSTPCSVTNPNDCKTIFTREIQISYLEDDWTTVTAALTANKMKVKSIVQWSDSSRNSWNYNITLETILTNWKKDL
jgi:hypothetical protein